MINIKDATGLANCAINCIGITITNCYPTVRRQGLLLSYTDVYPSGDGKAFPTVDTKCLATNLCTKIVSCGEPWKKSSCLSESPLHSLVWWPNVCTPQLNPTF